MSCSARLLAAEWNLHAPTVQQLQVNQPTVIEAVTVTALDANHCPGAIMLLFEVPTGQGQVTRILHTGDCRWVGPAGSSPVKREAAAMYDAGSGETAGGGNMCRSGGLTVMGSGTWCQQMLECKLVHPLGLSGAGVQAGVSCGLRGVSV